MLLFQYDTQYLLLINGFPPRSVYAASREHSQLPAAAGDPTSRVDN